MAELPTNPDDYLAFFNEWTERLRSSLEGTIPTLDDATKVTLATACQSLPDPESYTSWSEADDTVVPMLNMIESLTSETHDDATLVTYTILSQATPQALAEWCGHHDTNATQIMVFLNDTTLMRQFLASGGARLGRYGEAAALYHALMSTIATIADDSQTVPRRLALAVALELAVSYPLFNELPGAIIDAVARYHHYVDAYLDGDLDPAFEHFTVWELRHVINGDATNEELSWGRACLQAYRPDLAFESTNGAMWTYNFLVRTDVAYTTPDWYKQPRSYDQILSGGGKCGPRAWYGRFMCKAFGIPTWGVRQPGHAAMMRWTGDAGKGPNWQSCLGGGMHTSWWGDDRRCGLDFLLETQARASPHGEDWYTRHVLRLEWVAAWCGESNDTVRQSCRPDPHHIWYALALFQRRRLAHEASSVCVDRPPPTRPNKIWNLSHDTPMDEPVRYDATTDTVTIPATGYKEATTNKIVVMPSFQGGRQVFVKEDARLEYTVDRPTTTWIQCMLTMRVATAHRSEQPITITFTSSNETWTLTVPLPYTMGLWGDTEPVLVTWHGNDALTIRLERPHQPFGFAWKHMLLTPVCSNTV